MEKNVRLADIYIKIYNKQTLTMDDLVFLSKYDRECFEKTCRNLIYNIPDAKKLMEAKAKEEPSFQKAGMETEKEAEKEIEKEIGEKIKENAKEESGRDEVGILLENLGKMEWEEFPIQNISTDHVKNLLGSLYMEMLFPHNDRYRYFQLEDHVDSSIFNKKA